MQRSSVFKKGIQQKSNQANTVQPSAEEKQPLKRKNSSNQDEDQEVAPLPTISDDVTDFLKLSQVHRWIGVRHEIVHQQMPVRPWLEGDNFEDVTF